MDDLVARAKHGDRGAFGILVRRHQPMVYRAVLRLVRHEDDAMDLTQDAFVRAYERLSSFQGASSFATWIYRIATNLALNHLRAQRPRVDVDMSMMAAHAAPSSKDREQTITKRLDEAIAGLPPRQRLTVLLRVRDGKTHEEIASLLGCAVGTSKAAFHGAVANLRKALVDIVPLLEEEDASHLT